MVCVRATEGCPFQVRGGHPPALGCQIVLPYDNYPDLQLFPFSSFFKQPHYLRVVEGKIPKIPHVQHQFAHQAPIMKGQACQPQRGARRGYQQPSPHIPVRDIIRSDL